MMGFSWVWHPTVGDDGELGGAYYLYRNGIPIIRDGQMVVRG